MAKPANMISIPLDPADSRHLWSLRHLTINRRRGVWKRASAQLSTAAACSEVNVIANLGAGAWFAVQVVPQHEKTVAALLEWKGYEYFLPTHLNRRRWLDRSKVLRQPLFPGYVFCRTKESAVGLVRSTPGVIRILTFGGKPARIPDEEIDAVSRVLEAGLDVSPFAPWLRLGQIVEVHRGPLRGLAGKLVAVENNARLILSIEVTMQAISVEIDVADVRVIARSASLPSSLAGSSKAADHR